MNSTSSLRSEHDYSVNADPFLKADFIVDGDFIADGDSIVDGDYIVNGDYIVDGDSISEVDSKAGVRPDFRCSDGCRLIGLTGGIGSGKSVVSRILRLRGEWVYDCDLEARRLMEKEEYVRQGLVKICGSAVFTPVGNLDRQYLGMRLFSEPELRKTVNTLVHGAVLEDILNWRKKLQTEGWDQAFVESAILFGSGIDRIVDEVWIVYAPEEERIRRVCQRNSLTEGQVRNRIRAQAEEEAAALRNERGLRIRFFRNGEDDSLLAQLGDMGKAGGGYRKR